MTVQDFQKIVEQRIGIIRRSLTAKGEEYSRDGDRLHNFKVAGKLLNESPENALLGMMVKHWVSIRDMIQDIEKGITHDPKVWNEKIADAINYPILLDGLLMERMSNDQNVVVAQPLTPDNTKNGGDCCRIAKGPAKAPDFNDCICDADGEEPNPHCPIHGYDKDGPL